MDPKNAASYRQAPPAAPAEGREKYRTFEDLDAYQAAREFRKEMYAVTRQLPGFEKFELGSQIHRAAVSLTTNIAEGHGRYHYLEQIKFCLNARGSLEGLLNDLNVCQDESYLPSDRIDRLKQHGRRVQQVLNGYMRRLRGRKQGTSTELRETSHDDFTEDELSELLSDAQAVSTFQPFNVSTK